MRLPKYSMGIGDRFAHQGLAQLDAVIEANRQLAAAQGASASAVIAPVWNKSHREHKIVGSRPDDVRAVEFLAAHTRYRGDAQAVERILAALGDRGVMDVVIGRTPFGLIVQELMGYEATEGWLAHVTPLSYQKAITW